MDKTITRFREVMALEKKVLKEHKDIVNTQNLFTLRVILLAAIVIFLANFLFSEFTSPATYAKNSYLPQVYMQIIFVALVIYILVKKFSNINCQFAIYATYTVAVLYCIITSSFISPNNVSVTFLAVVFQIPILFLDKSARMNLFTILGTILYLFAIYFYKDRVLMVDEIVNAVSFSALAMTIGTFARQAKIENIYVKEEFKRLAYYDALTGIFNRRKLFEDLQDSHKKGKIFTAIAMVDVDYFKKYNDTYGHQKGDECLKLIVQCLESFKVQNDIEIYRFGGEEFIVLFKESSQEVIYNLAKAMCLRVEMMEIEHKTCELRKVSISLGLCFVDKCDAQGYETIISNADVALYAAKAKTRNCVVKFDDTLKQAAS